MARITNPYILDKKQRRYLLSIYKWYHTNNYDQAPFFRYNIRIHILERILIDNEYEESDSKYLNDLKQIVPWVNKKEDDKKQAAKEYDDLPF